MALGGWIKVHRALLDHHVSSDPSSLSIWMHLLMLANHTETKRQINGRVVTLKPGQLITSRKSLSEKTGVHESKVTRVLNMLESEQQIAQHGTSKFRVISIVNWLSYQEDEQQSEQQTNSKRTASEQQVNTPEECKEWEKGKEDQSSSKTVRRNWLKELIAAGVEEGHARDWLAVRKLKKASNSDSAFNAIKCEAQKAGISFGEAVKIAAENSWQGFKATWLEKKTVSTRSEKPSMHSGFDDIDYRQGAGMENEDGSLSF